MRLLLPLPPSANRYWRNVNGRTLVSKEGREYRERCAFAAALQWKHALIEDKIAMHVDVYRDLRGDLDNHVKVLVDSLRGVAFVDDSQIWDLRLVRHLDRANPRVELTIAPLEAA